MRMIENSSFETSFTPYMTTTDANHTRRACERAGREADDQKKNRELLQGIDGEGRATVTAGTPRVGKKTHVCVSVSVSGGVGHRECGHTVLGNGNVHIQLDLRCSWVGAVVKVVGGGWRGVSQHGKPSESDIPLKTTEGGHGARRDNEKHHKWLLTLERRVTKTRPQPPNASRTASSPQT